MDLEIDVGSRIGHVSGILRRPLDAWAGYVLAHGAGAGMRHHFMEEIAEALGKPSWNAARLATARALLRLAEELKRGT